MYLGKHFHYNHFAAVAGQGKYKQILSYCLSTWVMKVVFSRTKDGQIQMSSKFLFAYISISYQIKVLKVQNKLKKEWICGKFSTTQQWLVLCLASHILVTLANLVWSHTLPIRDKTDYQVYKTLCRKETLIYQPMVELRGIKLNKTSMCTVDNLSFHQL